VTKAAARNGAWQMNAPLPATDAQLLEFQHAALPWENRLEGGFLCHEAQLGEIDAEGRQLRLLGHLLRTAHHACQPRLQCAVVFEVDTHGLQQAGGRGDCQGEAAGMCDRTHAARRPYGIALRSRQDGHRGAADCRQRLSSRGAAGAEFAATLVDGVGDQLLFVCEFASGPSDDRGGGDAATAGQPAVQPVQQPLELLMPM
jgi:hypothetical protein